MMEGEFRKAVAMLHRDRKQFDEIVLHLSFNDFRPLVTELEFTNAGLNSNFPVTSNTKIESIVGVKKYAAVFFCKSFVTVNGP